MHHIDWYFDVISPFSYLQWCRLREMGQLDGVQAKPVLFAGLLRHWQHKGPAELPGKRRFTYRHTLWLAERHGVRLRYPPEHPFNPMRALRLIAGLDCRRDVIDAVFRLIWEQGRDINSVIEWNVLQMRLGMVNGNAIVADSQSKEKLRRFGEEALSAGVFGVPSLVIDGEVFWGFDATDMALEYLAHPQRFGTREYARVDALPVGVRRKELGEA